MVSESSDYIDPDTPTNPDRNTYKLVFSDEFNGKNINLSKWNLGINSQNIQNTTVVCLYDWKNITCNNGKLVFTQRKELPPINGKIWGKRSVPFFYSSGG
ncbi:MAG: hypothetical protein VXZ44_01055, partial [Verrucomicrobiota bacterium]|nr:hypothetical protein [Verrucomicrobiota bacterium]